MKFPSRTVRDGSALLLLLGSPPQSLPVTAMSVAVIPIAVTVSARGVAIMAHMHYWRSANDRRTIHHHRPRHVNHGRRCADNARRHIHNRGRAHDAGRWGKDHGRRAIRRSTRIADRITGVSISGAGDHGSNGDTRQNLSCGRPLPITRFGGLDLRACEGERNCDYDHFLHSDPFGFESC